MTRMLHTERIHLQGSEQPWHVRLSLAVEFRDTNFGVLEGLTHVCEILENGSGAFSTTNAMDQGLVRNDRRQSIA